MRPPTLPTVPPQELGIPTANVDPAAVHSALADAVTGIYAGFARVGDKPDVYLTVGRGRCS
jgi:riboflavin kinase